MKYLQVLLLILMGCSHETETVTQKEYTGKMELTVVFYQAEVKLDYGDYVHEFNMDSGLGYERHRKATLSVDIIQGYSLIDDSKPRVHFKDYIRINNDLADGYYKNDRYLEYIDLKSNKKIMLPYTEKIEIFRDTPKVYINNKLWKRDSTLEEFYFQNCNYIKKTFPLEDVSIYGGHVLVEFK